MTRAGDLKFVVPEGWVSREPSSGMRKVEYGVKDNEGKVLNLRKENVEVLSTHKNSDELLDILDGTGLPEGAFYKRIALD